MTETSLTVFTFEGNTPIRTLLDSKGNPQFVASDVCSYLDLANVSQALSRLDDDEKGDIILNDTAGRSNKFKTVNESGLYNLILRSDKPGAKAFKRWITHEVLPSIRKTGAYSVQAMTPAEIILMQAQKLVDLERAQREQSLAIRRIEDQNAELYEKQGNLALSIDKVVDRLDNADYFTVLQFCQRQKIKTTAAICQKWGKDAAKVSREQGIEIGEAIEGRYNVGRYHKAILLQVCVAKPKNPWQLPLLD